MSAGRAKPSMKSKVDQASSKLEDAFDRSKSFFRGSAGYTQEHNRPKSEYMYTKFGSMQRGRYGNALLDL